MTPLERYIYVARRGRDVVVGSVITRIVGQVMRIVCGTAVVLAAVMGLGSRAPAASFDCRRARAPVEKMICSDGQLSELDARLARSYRRAVDSAADPTGLKAAQRTWLATERSKCADVPCLEQAYQQRLNTIDAAGGARTDSGKAGRAGAKEVAYSFAQAPFISPQIIEDLSTSIADQGDQIVAINLTDAQGSNRYGEETEVVKKPGRNPYVRFQLKGEDGGDGTEFGYEYVGRTTSGVDVLRTSSWTGGSGRFENLLIVRLERDAGGGSLDDGGNKIETLTFKKQRTLIRKLGEISLGDRWDGQLKVIGNDIAIGKNTGWFSDKNPDKGRVVRIEFH